MEQLAEIEIGEMDGVQSDATGGFDVLGAVVHEDAVFGFPADRLAYMLVNSRIGFMHFDSVGAENPVEIGGEACRAIR